MDIQVGDRVTYEFIDGFGQKTKETIIITDDEETFVGDVKILKIERPKYDAIEEKKELLTEEEKEFLKSYIKFVESFKNGKAIEINKNDNWLVLTLKSEIEYQVEVGSKYENIPYYKIALKELGLESN